MKSRIVSFLLYFFAIFSQDMSWGCGPNIPEAVFSFAKRPDAPFENYARGTLGILKPTFNQSQLLIAYRYINGMGLDPEEQRLLLDYWQNGRDSHSEGNEGLDQWKVTLEDFTQSQAPDVRPYREYPQSHNWYLNCASDAFKTAIRTLNARINAFGKNSPEVVEWLSAQQIVFSNCEKGATIPQPANEDTAPIIRMDRTYQIAAAYFYSEQYDQAVSLFEEIAKDNSSPWNKIAFYLAVRALVRKADLQGDDTKQELLQQAKIELQDILDDPQLSEIHRASKLLLNTVNYRLNPIERMTELCGDLLRSNTVESVTEKLEDFIYMYDQGIRSNHDLSAWIEAYPRKDFATSVAKWQQTHSPHWLIAALASIQRNDPNLQALLEEANGIPADSPAYNTVLYESLRLMIHSGRKEDARRKLATFLAQHGDKLSLSALNSFTALRMQLSQSLDEFVADAKQRPAGIEWPEEDIGLPEDLQPAMKSELFRWDSTWILNRALPISLLISALEGDDLPENLKKQLAVATWTRAVLLNYDDHALKLAVILRDALPVLQGDLSSYISAGTKEERDFAFACLALKNPGIQPFIHSGFGRNAKFGGLELYRDNWWCALKKKLTEMDKKKEYLSGKDSFDLPEFIGQKETLDNQKETAILEKIESGPIHLGRIILKYAKANPKAHRVPEALHLAVRATRYGCPDEHRGGCSEEISVTSQISKDAFQLLHKKYPKSPWAQKTPYWF